MINESSLHAVNDSRFSQHFRKPRYDSYCFANLPTTIQFLLTGKGNSALPLDVFGKLPTRYEKVIFFFIDSFGWKFFERHAEKYNFLKHMLTHGVVSQLTSQFPSTTAAHITCMHTGLNVGQSGVYEWNYYEPLVDEIISPLLFSYAGDRARPNTLNQSSVPPANFFPAQTFYQTLADQGITSHIFQYKGYSPSTYSDVVYRGGTPHDYKNMRDGLEQLSNLLQAESNVPGYYFLYFDRIDTICHRSGPYSQRAEEEIDSFLLLMDEFFSHNMWGKASNTLFMLSTDHGHGEVDPETTWYLNQRLPAITPYIKTNRAGRSLVPAGSPRDMFLYIQEEHISEAVAMLRESLAGKAEVYPTQELLHQHIFGPETPSQTFLGRLGNVVILPYQHETVWWYEEGRFSMHFHGHHGGLTPEEMEIPLLVAPL
jgi:predicted AlkP superfamily pyrophosphatase or phosphodiesterase